MPIASLSNNPPRGREGIIINLRQVVGVDEQLELRRKLKLTLIQVASCDLN